MSVFSRAAHRTAKKVAHKAVEETIDNNWDTVLDILGLAAGAIVLFGGSKKPKQTTQNVSVTYNTYNYYGNQNQRRRKK